MEHSCRYLWGPGCTAQVHLAPDSLDKPGGDAFPHHRPPTTSSYGQREGFTSSGRLPSTTQTKCGAGISAVPGWLPGTPIHGFIQCPTTTKHLGLLRTPNRTGDSPPAPPTHHTKTAIHSSHHFLYTDSMFETGHSPTEECAPETEVK